MKFIIYCAQNKINGHRYIGMTKNGINHRRYAHENKARYYPDMRTVFIRALAEFGLDNFEWFELDAAETRKEAAEKERAFIVKFSAEYNFRHSPGSKEAREKLPQEFVKSGIDHAAAAKPYAANIPNYGKPQEISGIPVQ